MPPSHPPQPPSLEDVERAERELVFDGFDNDVAVDLGLRLVAAARAAALPVTIDIRRGGQQLFHAALPGTSADNDGWAERKARAVQRFGKSSLRLRLECEADGTTLEERFMLPPFEYAAHGGSFPVTVRGTGVVGAVTVSGLPQLEDHRFVVEQLHAFLGRG
jgi:uncharacterized protein (UPF0303 family)